ELVVALSVWLLIAGLLVSRLLLITRLLPIGLLWLTVLRIALRIALRVVIAREILAWSFIQVFTRYRQTCRDCQVCAETNSASTAWSGAIGLSPYTSPSRSITCAIVSIK